MELCIFPKKQKWTHFVFIFENLKPSFVAQSFILFRHWYSWFFIVDVFSSVAYQKITNIQGAVDSRTEAFNNIVDDNAE